MLAGSCVMVETKKKHMYIIEEKTRYNNVYLFGYEKIVELESNWEVDIASLCPKQVILKAVVPSCDQQWFKTPQTASWSGQQWFKTPQTAIVRSGQQRFTVGSSEVYQPALLWYVNTLLCFARYYSILLVGHFVRFSCCNALVVMSLFLLGRCIMSI